MNVTELILLIFGGIVFTVSFFLPAGRKKGSEGSSQADEELIRETIDREIEDAKKQISDIVDETITYSMEKTERSMERLTNEKIMAVNEYSDTVLEQINKNHKEAVFLYDMLNDKHENLKTTVSQAMKTATEVKQTVKDAEVTAREVKEQVTGEQTVSEKEPEKQFTPILAQKVEVTEVPVDLSEISEPVKSKRKTTKKKKTEEPAEREEIPETEKSEKAAKVDLSMTSPGKPDGRNNNERILELHKAGKSNMAIAKELGLGIGEVKLVIDLFEGI